MAIGMCRAHLKDRKIAMDLLLMLVLNEVICQLAMTGIIRWYGHVLSREDGHVLRTALDFEIEIQMKNGRLMST